MKSFYIAVTIQQDRNENIFTAEQTEPNYGYSAFVVKCSEQDNLKFVMDSIGGLLYANICPTKKAADELVKYWNEGFKKNGTSLFS